MNKKINNLEKTSEHKFIVKDQAIMSSTGNKIIQLPSISELNIINDQKHSIEVLDAEGNLVANLKPFHCITLEARWVLSTK